MDSPGGEESVTVGARLRALRLARGLSLGALSRRAGVRDSTLSRWENDRRLPLIPELEAVLDALEADDAGRRGLLNALAAPRAIVRVRALDGPGAPPTGGDLLRMLRLRKGWTQTEAARAVGVTQAQITRWERGDSWPDAEKLQTLCWHLGSDPDEAAALAAARGGRLVASAGRFPVSSAAPPSPEPDLPGGAAARSPETPPPWVHHVHMHLHHPPAPFALSIFGLRHRLAVLAARYPFAERLLADACAVQARNHLEREEYGPAAAVARQGLALARRCRTPGKPGGAHSLWFGNVIVLAACAARTGTASGQRRAVGMLTEWLPAVETCVPHHAWGRAALAGHLARSGDSVDREAAVALSAAVCGEVAAAFPVEYLCRLHDHADLLRDAGRPREALLTLERTRAGAAGAAGAVSDAFWARQEMLEAGCLAAL